MDAWARMFQEEADTLAFLLQEEFTEDIMTNQELEALLSEPMLGPFTTEQLAEMVAVWDAWNELQAVPSYVEQQAQAWAAELNLEVS